MINYGSQTISDADIEAVVEVLKSDFLTQGPVVPKFEKALAEKCQAQHAIAVSNGTAALHLACLALDINESDNVWVSSVSFVASANCASYCGAEVSFIDIDPNSGLISITDLQERLTTAALSNTLPKALITVHLAGQSCAMKQIKELCEQYNVYIIEDACHALGGRYMDKPVGSCQFSDISVFSFHPVKPITSGEGGALLTNSDKIAAKARLLANHGITKNQDQFINPSDGTWYYEMQQLGFNYRLTDIQAALGLSQLSRLDHFISTRNKLASFYDEVITDMGLPLQPLTQSPQCYNAYHLYVVRYTGSKAKNELFNLLRDNGINPNLHYIPIFLHPYYRKQKKPILPGAMRYYSEAITIPLYPELSEAQQRQVLDALQISCNS